MRMTTRALPLFVVISVIAVPYSLFITWQYVNIVQSHVQSTHGEHHRVVSAEAARSSIANAALASLSAHGGVAASKNEPNKESAEHPRRAGAHAAETGPQAATATASPPPVPSGPPPGPRGEFRRQIIPFAARPVARRAAGSIARTLHQKLASSMRRHRRLR